jgi:hypothetical protein
VTAEERWDAAVTELLDAVDGFIARETIAASLTTDEKLEMMRGMVLMRALDNRLKQFYLQPEVKYGALGVQGKGFRSLGQEAIYGAGIRLHRGAAYRDGEGGWHGDVVCPLIRDNALVLAMHNDPWTIRMILNAQIGKAGPPMNGRDIHVADFGWGILPPTAPLGINAVNIAGVAMAFAREGSDRVAFSLIGEGGSSLGEWHEASTRARCESCPRSSAFRTIRPRFHAGARTVGRAHVRGQGRRLRGARHHGRRHRTGSDRRRVHVGGRSRPQRTGADARRARVDAHVRPRAPRRHAVPRKGAAGLVGVRTRRGGRLRQPRAVRVLVEEGSYRRLRREAARRGADASRRSRQVQA